MNRSFDCLPLVKVTDDVFYHIMPCLEPAVQTSKPADDMAENLHSRSKLKKDLLSHTLCSYAALFIAASKTPFSASFFTHLCRAGP